MCDNLRSILRRLRSMLAVVSCGRVLSTTSRATVSEQICTSPGWPWCSSDSNISSARVQYSCRLLFDSPHGVLELARTTREKGGSRDFVRAVHAPALTTCELRRTLYVSKTRWCSCGCVISPGRGPHVGHHARGKGGHGVGSGSRRSPTVVGMSHLAREIRGCVGK